MPYDELDDNKLEVSHKEHGGSTTPSSAEAGSRPHHHDIDAGFDPEFVKRVTRKVDWRLIPVLTCMYAVSLIDRTNLSYARQANEAHMDKELGTGGNNMRYSIITAVFFVPYIILEIPSQLGLRQFGARYWLGSAVILWGIAELAMGFVTNWQQLAALRAVLGAFESALFPGAAYLLACWYPRKLMASRNVVFYNVAALLGNLSSPLGYTYTLLHRRRNLSGWAWMFILSGVLTILIGIAAFLLLVDVPNKATFLTEEERNFINTRIERDRADAEDDPVTLAKIGTYLCDWKLWLCGIFFMSNNIATYSQAYFLPQILGSMGFDYIGTMLLGSPAYGWAMIPALTCAYIADRHRGMRAFMIMFNSLCVIAGTAMFSKLPVSQKAARYAGVFIAVGGANANVGLLISWFQTSIRKQSKRAVASALVVCWGGIGGILAGFVMLNKEARKGYPTGINFCLAMNAFVFVGSGFLSLYFRWMNRRADRGEIVLEGDENFRYQP